ncbi:MAG TPA: hypothetical protein VEJ63_11755 [Planctomycetota bacterium]|nr:hypothetical protein [Planctomycetota bacterium]
MRTPRESFVLALLPAIVVVGGYFWLYGANMTRTLRSLETETAKGRENDSTPRLNSLLAQASKLEDELELERARAVQPPAVVALEADATAGLKTLTKTLEQHGLRLLSSQRVENSQPDLSAVANAQSSGTSQCFRVDFVGSYPDTLKALESLINCGACIIPAGIDMSTDDIEDAQRRWSLTVWM